MRLNFGHPPFLIWAGVPSLVAIAIIWFPFGLTMGGLIEEWDMLRLFDKHGPQWNAFPGQPLSELFAARPLAPLPFLVARLIDDTSFLGFHVVLMAACVLKVLAGASIGYTMFRNRTLALAMGLLLLVYPADTQQIALRNIHINLAVALMACACALALRGLFAERRRSRALSMGSSIVLGMLGALIYEPAFTLYALTPLMLFARQGLLGAVRLVARRRLEAACWFAGAAASTAYLYYVLRVVRVQYQAALSGGEKTGVLGSIAANSNRLLDSGAARTFVEGWTSAWNIATELTVHWAYPVLVGLAVLGVMRSAAFDLRVFRVGSIRPVRYVAAGALAATAGYLPYLVSVSHLEITQRTFLAVAPGAALIATTIIAVIARITRVNATLIAAAPITLGIIAQAYQHDRYARAYSDYIRPYLEYVAARSDSTKRVHLVQDTSGVGAFLNGIYFTKLRDGLPVIRRAADDTYILCMDQPLSAMSFFSNCRLEGDRWIVTSYHGSPLSFRSVETEVIQVGPEFASSPEPLASYWRHLGTFEDADSLFKPEGGQAHFYDCTAESMWGYSGFCAGRGWSDGAVVRDGLTTRSRFWAISPEASLIFRLRPVSTPYALRIQFSAAPPAAIANRWSIALNGAVLDRQWLTPRLLEASVPASLLRNGLNELQFHDAIAAGAGKGLAIERAVLAPIGNPHLISAEPPPTLRPGTRYPSNDATAARTLDAGFSDTEQNGTWTDGSTATIRFSVPRTGRAMTLNASVVPFLNENHPAMIVDFTVNGVSSGQQRFTDPGALQVLRIPLPREALAAGTPIEVKLDIKNPASPEAVGAGQRWLGLFFKELEITEDRTGGKKQ
jgi:hypothetical protein